MKTKTPLLIILLSLLLLAMPADAEETVTHHAYLPVVLKDTSNVPNPHVEGVFFWGTGGRETAQIAPGESFVIHLEAVNRASAAAATEGKLVIGFPSLADVSDLMLEDSSANLTDAQVYSDTYPAMMLSYGGWEEGEHIAADIRVGPVRMVGDFPVYVKAVGLLAGVGDPAVYISPLDGRPGARDADGETSQVYTVTVAYVGPGVGRLNYYRSLAGVPLAVEYSPWSQGCAAHAYYMVMNGVITHTEDAQNPYYTYDGLAAAQSSNLVGFRETGMGQQDGWPVDVMMQSPFHAIPMLDPRLEHAGYGQSSNPGGSQPFAACLDVYRGVDYMAASTWPVYWPPDGGRTPLVEYTGGETPDPLAPCGYSVPTGAPLFVMVDNGLDDRVISSTSLETDSGGSVVHCAYDYSTYTNPDPDDEQLGRDVLNNYDAFVIVPQSPLAPGERYTASITLNDGAVYSWTFQVSPGFVDAPSGTILSPVQTSDRSGAASCDAVLDEALLLGPEEGVTYREGAWSFVGIVDDAAIDHLGGRDVDLVRVRFVYSGTIHTAWVTAGVTMPDGTYLSAGGWRSRDEMRALLRPADAYVRVYAGGPGEPVSTPDGVDWTACDTPWCAFARNVESLWTLEDGLSTVFARSGMSLSWWPWGYLPWHIDVGRVNVGWCGMR